jgi:hypothetical protein
LPGKTGQGDDDVGGLHGFGGEGFGEFLGQVEPDLGHGLRDGGVDRVGGRGAGGADHDPALGVVVEQSGGHLGAAGVVDADEQDFGFVRHGVSLTSGDGVESLAGGEDG